MSATIDFVGYQTLIDYINEHHLYQLEGDFVEIGAFVGGGTVKLAKLAGAYGKKVFVIDIFDPTADVTATPDGTKMSDIYLAFLEGRSQYQTYCENTRNCDNIVTIKEDSKKVKFPVNQRFMFGFIDGNHQPDYVRNDFLLIWDNLVSGGVVALHDYKSELPEVTRTIDRLLDEKKKKIASTTEISEKHIVLVTKK
ncbi:MAG TPA: class I SAM-dependent methyltransferase [Dehalococcoidales bacterium]